MNKFANKLLLCGSLFLGATSEGFTADLDAREIAHAINEAGLTEGAQFTLGGRKFQISSIECAGKVSPGYVHPEIHTRVSAKDFLENAIRGAHVCVNTLKNPLGVHNAGFGARSFDLGTSDLELFIGSSDSTTYKDGGALFITGKLCTLEAEMEDLSNILDGLEAQINELMPLKSSMGDYDYIMKTSDITMKLVELMQPALNIIRSENFSGANAENAASDVLRCQNLLLKMTGGKPLQKTPFETISDYRAQLEMLESNPELIALNQKLEQRSLDIKEDAEAYKNMPFDQIEERYLVNGGVESTESYSEQTKKAMEDFSKKSLSELAEMLEQLTDLSK